MTGESSPERSLAYTVIEPAPQWVSLNLRELWEYRELLWFLTLRDIMVRYKQAALGIGWAVIQPVMMMVVFSLVFGTLAKLPSDGVPYPLFTFAALLPWQLFAGGLQRSSTSLVANSNLITKVYFPRLIIPLSAVLGGLVDFGISLLVLLGLTVFYGLHLTLAVLWLPALVLLAVCTALAVGFWSSALNVQYRDVQQAMPFLIQFWMYASPVAYSANLVPQGKWRFIYALNPMAGVIQGFRWALLGGTAPDAWMLVSVVVVVVLLVAGFAYFRRMEKTFADVV